MSMIASRRISSSTSRRYVKTIQTAVSPSTPAWQHARYLATSNRSIPRHLTAQSQLSLSSSFLQPSFTASGLTSTISSNPQPHRPLHTSHTLRQQGAQRKPDPSTASEPNPSEASPKESSSESKSDEPKTSEKGQTEGEGEAEAEGDQKKDKKDAAPPPPHGDKTPWQVFRETWSSELKASQEWNDSTKQLAGEVQDFRDSEAVKKASVAYDKTFGAAGRGAHTAAKAVGTGATIAWETPVVQGVRKGVNATGRGIERATRPVRESEAFKKISEAIDDGSSSRYGGWVEKEERRARRAAREAKNPSLKVENHEEDPNAGTNITLHKDAAWKEAWNNFKDSSKLGDTMRTWRSTYEESENPLISTARSITDRIAGFFAENETAMVIKKLREMDPNFQMEPFLQDMREFALLEVLDAYVKGDVETLKLWLSAAQFQVYSALMEQYTKHGLKSDGKIVDIRGVEVLNARLLEPGEIPVLILTARTQEIHCYRNKKTNELAAGTEDKIQQVTYAIGVTRLPEEVNNPETRGWRVIELQKAARDYI